MRVVLLVCVAFVYMYVFKSIAEVPAGRIAVLFCGRNTFFPGSCHCAAVLFSQVPKKCTDLHLSLLHILILGTYSKFARSEKNFLALGVKFPQSSGCSSAGRRFAASRSRLQYYRRIASFPKKNSMKCAVNWIPLTIRARSKNFQPHLNTPHVVFWRRSIPGARQEPQ